MAPFYDNQSGRLLLTDRHLVCGQTTSSSTPRSMPRERRPRRGTIGSQSSQCRCRRRASGPLPRRLLRDVLAEDSAWQQVRPTVSLSRRRYEAAQPNRPRASWAEFVAALDSLLAENDQIAADR